MTPTADNRFELRATDPLRADTHFVLQMQSPEQYTEWVETISELLQAQNNFLKAIADPIKHQYKLTNES